MIKVLSRNKQASKDDACRFPGQATSSWKIRLFLIPRFPDAMPKAVRDVTKSVWWTFMDSFGFWKNKSIFLGDSLLDT
jgi:hypothetical protein